MYTMIDSDEKVYLTKEEYIQRNSKIYEGIEVSDIKISHIAVKEKKADTVTLSYETSCNTIAGTIQFDNMAELKKTKQGYKLVWQDSLIFPDLESDDKISVTTSKAERGEILDRDGKMLAGKGVATSVGIIPGKLEDRNVSIEKIAELLEIDVETINNKLTAKWVKEDSFVPIETIPKVEEIDLMKIQPEEKTLEEQDCQNKLLEIPGVMLSDVEVRTYELGEAAAHLIGYVQSVTAEDLENHPGEGYSAESVIGRSGVEKLYEKQLKGKDGCDIKILDSDGEVKEVLASIFKEDGMDIRLTIDSDLQKSLYEQFKEDPGCSVAMNPYTGEVLALVSTPSYDNNEFIRGLSSEKWTSLNEDEKKPLYNRFRQVWCPGSTFKPVVAGIGLKTDIEAVDPDSVEMKTAELLSGIDGTMMFRYNSKDTFQALYVYLSEYHSGKRVSHKRVLELSYEDVKSAKNGLIVITPDFDNFTAKLIAADEYSKYMTEMPILEGVANREYYGRSATSIENKSTIEYGTEQGLAALIYGEQGVSSLPIQDITGEYIDTDNEYMYYYSAEFVK